MNDSLATKLKSKKNFTSSTQTSNHILINDPFGIKHKTYLNKNNMFGSLTIKLLKS